MLTLKRLAVWSLERFVEGLLLGGLLYYLLSGGARDASLSLRNWLSSFSIVAVFLFLHGYYVTTAFFGVVWRSAKTLVYPTIISTLFIFHTHIVFMHAGTDFTPEMRAMELPFALGGVGIVFSSALGGSCILRKWINVGSNSNAYLSALGLTLLVLTLANIAHFLRPVVGSSAFRLYGLPFTFYRDGGFVKEWVWQPGQLIWRGMIADLAVIAAVVLFLGRALQTVRAR